LYICKTQTYNVMQKYPIGIQNFQKLRQGGFVYIDKTQYIYNLTQQAGYYFLSRPRRFGKSLLVSTLQALYEGKKELFEGLWIADKWNFAQTNPTVVLYFNQMSLRDTSLLKSLAYTIEDHAKQYQITLETEGIGRQFQELLQKLYTKTGRKVVVLIDEYDKAIVDFLEDPTTAETNRDILKSFYGILKPSDEYIEFVLLTGVSKFSKVSVFSDLNNLNDISLDEDNAAIAGITQSEVEHYFAQEITAIAAHKEITKEVFLAQIKKWYNGYSWKGNYRVYNPFSLLNFFSKKGNFQNYWFSTGSPTWLIKEAFKQRMFDFTNIEITENKLNDFDLRNLSPVAILFQTGYLTIKSYDPDDGIYCLDYPNQEVRLSLNQYLLETFRTKENEEVIPFILKIRNGLKNNDIAVVIESINTVFSTLPYDLWQKENERFYHAIIHLTFTLLGVYIQSEVHTSQGRCDALVQTDDYVYAFEFKLDKTSQEALKQIETKKYLAPFAQSPKTCIGIGINFSSSQKIIENWQAQSFFL
jgi:Predicted AAA-ATPase/PD-(D/E)XK nuclease superfamily